MPDLVEQMYCSQQIFIPPNLPSILKKYAKAAIRTQPGDLLIWSSAYFRALAQGIPPPTKERIEYPPVDSPSGLSPGFLKVLINQLGKGETISKEIIEERWRGVCLNMQALHDLLAVGMFGDDVHWLEFIAICAGTLQPSLTKTMMQICELLTEEPEGGSASIPVSLFLNLYKYLAKLDCGPVNTLEQYEKTMKEDSETECIAEVLQPQEEVTSAVPDIDWDTAIGNETTPEKEEQNEEVKLETEDVNEAEETPKDTEVEAVRDQLGDTGEAATASGDGEENKLDLEEAKDETLKDDEAKEPNDADETLSDDEAKEPATNEEKTKDEPINDDEEPEKNEMKDRTTKDDSTGEQDKDDEKTKDGTMDDETEVPDEDSDKTKDEAVIDSETEKQDKGEEETEAGITNVDETEKQDKDEEETKDGAIKEDETEVQDKDEEETKDGTIKDDETQVQDKGEEETEDGITNDDETEKQDKDEEETKDGAIKDDKTEVQEKDEEETKEGTIKDDETDKQDKDEEEMKDGTIKDDETKVPQEDVDKTKDDTAKDSGTEELDKDEDETKYEPIKDDEQEVPDEDADKTEDITVKNDGTEEQDKEEDETKEKMVGDPDAEDADKAKDEPIQGDKIEQPDEDSDAKDDSDSGVVTADENHKGATDNGPAEPVAAIANAIPADPDDEGSIPPETPSGITNEAQNPDEPEPSDTANNNDPPEEPDAIDAVSNDSAGEVSTEDTNDTKEANREPQKLESLNIGSVYIIDDDGTLSAAPQPGSAKNEGDLQDRDSDQTIATNPSDVGMMVWPDIKPENEEVEVEHLVEKEVTSEDGIEVLADGDHQTTQEEIKILPEVSEESQIEAYNEENIFAPQIDSFTDLVEAESAPAEELSGGEMAMAEGSDLAGDEGTRPQEVMVSPSGTEVVLGPGSPAAEQADMTEDGTKSKLEGRKDADIESLVKKDSEMMLLPTPVTSDIMLYVDTECEKSSRNVAPSQILTNKMSLVDVQVAVPVDETVVEVFERHLYPKWMNIPGIGPVVPDHIIEEAEKYFLKVSELQEGMVMPRNIKHFHCPPLEMTPECIEN